MMDMPMPMWFYTSSDVYFLFDGCESKTVGGLLLGLIVTLFLSFLIPFFTYLKANLPRNTDAATHPAEQEALKGSPKETLTLNTRLLLTAITGVQYAVSGLVMLLFMTFNLWVFFAIIIGYTTGYFFLVSGTELVEKEKEHCH